MAEIRLACSEPDAMPLLTWLWLVLVLVVPVLLRGAELALLLTFLIIDGGSIVISYLFSRSYC